MKLMMKILKFYVHMHADKWHRAVVRKMLVELGKTKEHRSEILEAVKSSLNVLNNFLTGMEKTYC